MFQMNSLMISLLDLPSQEAHFGRSVFSLMAYWQASRIHTQSSSPVGHILSSTTQLITWSFQGQLFHLHGGMLTVLYFALMLKVG